MNNERVLEALQARESGSTMTWAQVDAIVEAVRELAWFANSCAGNKALFGGRPKALA